MNETAKPNREPEAAQSRGDVLRRPRVRLGAVVAVAVAAGVIAWLVVGRGGSSSSPSATKGPAGSGKGPVALSPTALRDLAGVVHHPIYWAGPKPGFTYEVTERRDGTIYVRYLPRGVKVGDPRGSFLIIVTYPYPNAYLALQRVENGKGIRTPRGGLALVHHDYPESVHLAYPGSNYQIEVYDPSPKVSRRVATSGQVRSVR